jgi:HEAT repeat protein
MGKAGGHSSASAWLEALKTTETADRRWKRAVRALTAMGLPVVPALIEATGDDHPEVRRGASTALRKIGPAIIPFLIKALRHDNWLVRQTAARGLYGFAPKAQQAISSLCEALQDSHPFVRQYVVAALGNLAYSFGPILKVAVPGLTDLLKDDDFVVREWAAHALGSIGASATAAIPALKAAATGDAEPTVKEAAASALGEIQKALP